MKTEVSHIKFYQMVIKKYQGFFIILIIGLFFLIGQTAKADPLPPTNLTARSAGPVQINLSWNYDSPETIDAFSVYRNGVEIIKFSAAALTHHYGDYFIEYSNAGLTVNTLYSYEVTAWDESRESAKSTASQAWTSEAPNAPTDIKINNVVPPVETTDTTPEISWTYADADPGSTNMKAYRIIVYVRNNEDYDDILDREMWDSGKILKDAVSGSTVTVNYNDADGSGDDNNSTGHPLDWGGYFDGTSYLDYKVKIQVWDSYDLASDFNVDLGAGFKPVISGSYFTERFESDDNKDAAVTTADWNMVYGEARLNSFATANTFKTLVNSGFSVKPVVFVDDHLLGLENVKYYAAYFKKTTGNYGLYYNVFNADGVPQLTEVQLISDVGTAESGNSVLGHFITNDISCDLVSVPIKCGIVYSAGPLGWPNGNDAYFFEINATTGEKTINPVQLNGQGGGKLNEMTPVIAYGYNDLTLERRYLVSWYEDDYTGGSPGQRDAYYKLINPASPSPINPLPFDTGIHSNAYPSVTYNSNDKQFGITWSRGPDVSGSTNSEVFFNIINWDGSQLIPVLDQCSGNCPVAGKRLTFSDNGETIAAYSNYSSVKWVDGGVYGSTYVVIWKDSRNYLFEYPHYPSLIDVYFTKLAPSGGTLLSNIKITDFPSRRKYVLSESSGVDCGGGEYAFAWLDDRGIGNISNDPLLTAKTFSSYYAKFTITDEFSINKVIADSLISSITLPSAQAGNRNDAYNSERSVLLPVSAGVCPGHNSLIFDQGGKIYMQNIPNQNNYFDLYNTTDDLLQSSSLDSFPAGYLAKATLYASDNRPDGTSIQYYLSNDDGASWQLATSGQEVEFSNPNGTSLKWQAELNGTSDATPIIGSLTFTFASLLPPGQPDNLLVDNWNSTATTTENFTPQLTFTYHDPSASDMTAYRLQVCADEFNATTGLCPAGELMWDSGKTTASAENEQSFTVSYNDSCVDTVCYDDSNDSYGHPLDWQDNILDYYHWQVKTWNTDDLASAWSAEYPTEISAKFRYGDDTTDPPTLDDFIFTDDFTTEDYHDSSNPEDMADWYKGVKGEIRIPYNWLSGSPSGSAIDLTGYVGKYTSLALDSKNKPHICYYDETNNKLKYGSLTDTNWQLPINWAFEDVNSGGGYNCSLTFDVNDNPHISYYNKPVSPDTKADLIYATKSGANWQVTTIKTDAVVDDFTISRSSIVINNQGLPAVSFFYKPVYPGRIAVARCLISPCDTPWTIDYFNLPEDRNSGLENSLADDSDGNLYLVYNEVSDTNNRKLKFRFFNQSVWSDTELIYQSGTNQSPTNISVALDNENKVAVSYSVTISSNGTLKYAQRISEDTWNDESVATYSGGLQAYTSLSFSSLNLPRIIFNGPSWDLYFAIKESIWNITTIESGTPNIGRYSSLFLDNSDLPYVSYWYYDNNDLMFNRHVFNTSNTYTAASTKVNPTDDPIYGVKFHASFSKPGGGGTIKFKLTADGWAHSTGYIFDDDSCINSLDGCPINFFQEAATGTDLRWMAEITSDDANYSPKIGSITFESYNVPPTIFWCSYYPPAIDPTQIVLISAFVNNEPDEDLEFSWCYDLDGGAGDCSMPAAPPEVPVDWTNWDVAGNPTNYIYNTANIYNPEVRARDELNQYSGDPPGDPYLCDNLFVGDVQIAWLETKFGNIYSQGDLLGYGVPCEADCGNRNATYILEAGESIIGFVSDCYRRCTGLSGPAWGISQDQCQAECTKQNSAPINFPKNTLHYRNVLGDLTADNVIKELLTNGENYEDPGYPPTGFEGEMAMIDTEGCYDKETDQCLSTPETIFCDIADSSNFWTHEDPEGIYAMFHPIIYYRDPVIDYGSETPTFELNYKCQTNSKPPSSWDSDLKGFKNSTSGSGASTIIVDGDLHIRSGWTFNPGGEPQSPSSTPSIVYKNEYNGSPLNPITKISELASVAWIIKGDLIIEYDVEELAGNFIVLGADGVECEMDGKQYTKHCGAVYTAGRNDDGTDPSKLIIGDSWIPVLERKTLTINGFVMAKVFSLGRHFLSYEPPYFPAESIIYDGRAVLNPPPGLADLISSLPDFRPRILP